MLVEMTEQDGSNMRKGSFQNVNPVEWRTKITNEWKERGNFSLLFLLVCFILLTKHMIRKVCEHRDDGDRARILWMYVFVFCFGLGEICWCGNKIKSSNNSMASA